MVTHNMVTHSCVRVQVHGHIQDVATIQIKVSILNTPILTQFSTKSIKSDGIFKTKTTFQVFGKHNMTTKLSEVSTPHIVLLCSLFPYYATQFRVNQMSSLPANVVICQS